MNIVAHPYALALFDLAKSAKKENAWLDTLAALKQIASDRQFADLVNNPKIDSKQLIAIIKQMLPAANAEAEELLVILAENNRLLALVEIYDLYHALVLEDQKKATAIIESAYEMTREQQADFEQILSHKFGKTISSKVVVNPDLIGGIKVLINDKVIDASIKGRLANLASQLNK